MADSSISPDIRRRLKDEQLRRTQSPHLAHVIERNIEIVRRIHQQMEERRGFQERVADVITALSGSMAFVWVHIVWFAAWIIINLGWTPFRVFDPFPFGLLTMIVSLEAIFLSTFVLITQNRMQEVSDQRAELDLQTDLLAEHEITRILKLVDAIADHLGVQEGRDPEVEELKENVAPDLVAHEIERKNGTAHGKRR